MITARASYLFLVIGSLAGDAIVAAIGGAFLILNTLLQAKIARDVVQTKNVAIDNNRKVTDVHGMQDQRGVERREKDLKVSTDRRHKKDRRRNADT